MIAKCVICNPVEINFIKSLADTVFCSSNCAVEYLTDVIYQERAERAFAEGFLRGVLLQLKAGSDYKQIIGVIERRLNE